MEVALVIVALVALAAVGAAIHFARRRPDAAARLDPAEIERVVSTLRGELAQVQAGAPSRRRRAAKRPSRRASRRSTRA